ncbi:MAG TPA: DUF72 domain-containing protein [Candidatus Acidoferrum sp.]|nr:DUF72 domain-containing protein [Candidatus Acidoferrum sp.]
MPRPGGGPGRLLVGTSGFAYPAWAPRFYPPGLKGDALLPYYATRFPSCELNNTFYQQPTEAKIASWLAATPEDFRFVVKAQRGGSLRALFTDPVGSSAWLTAPYRHFGERLGSVLFRIPANVGRDDEKLAAMLAAWPRDMPLTIEAQDPSWAVDEVFDVLRSAGASWCATDLDGQDAPDLRLIAPWLYLRLRRTTYDQAELEAWAARLGPFLDAGHDAFVFFRHDEDGASAVRAESFGRLVDAVRTR